MVMLISNLSFFVIIFATCCLVQLPELAVDDVEVLVGEEVRDLINVVLFLEEPQRGEKGRPSQLRHGDSSAPGPVHRVEDPSYHLKISFLLKIIIVTDRSPHKAMLVRTRKIRYNSSFTQGSKLLSISAS
jgi:hypothetical protein